MAGSPNVDIINWQMPAWSSGKIHQSVFLQNPSLANDIEISPALVSVKSAVALTACSHVVQLKFLKRPFYKTFLKSEIVNFLRNIL